MPYFSQALPKANVEFQFSTFLLLLSSYTKSKSLNSIISQTIRSRPTQPPHVSLCLSVSKDRVGYEYARTDSTGEKAINAAINECEQWKKRGEGGEAPAAKGRGRRGLSSSQTFLWKRVVHCCLRRSRTFVLFETKRLLLGGAEWKTRGKWNPPCGRLFKPNIFCSSSLPLPAVFLIC